MGKKFEGILSQNLRSGDSSKSLHARVPHQVGESAVIDNDAVSRSGNDLPVTNQSIIE
jgi:hypothetical protein